MAAGFELNRNQSASEFVGTTELYDIASGHSTRLAVGDVVRLTGTSNATTGRAGVDAVTQAQSLTGVIESFAPDLENESLNDAGGLAASTAGTALVIIDPNSLFEAEADATLSAVDVGLNVEALITAATQSGGLTISNMEIDSSTKASTSTLHFRIVKLLEGKTSGVLGDRALVRINNSTIRAGATGV